MTVYNSVGYSQDILDRFWSKVIPPVHENDCWIWNGLTDKNGYGTFTNKGNSIRAHRFSYECFNGCFNKNLLVFTFM